MAERWDDACEWPAEQRHQEDVLPRRRQRAEPPRAAHRPSMVQPFVTIAIAELNLLLCAPQSLRACDIIGKSKQNNVFEQENVCATDSGRLNGALGTTCPWKFAKWLRRPARGRTKQI